MLAAAERTAQIKVQVEPCLHRLVKIRAAEEGVSITRYVTGLLEREMEREPREEKTDK